MEILVLGSGGAFSDKFGNTQFYIDNGSPETSLLFDCGVTHLENTRKCNFNRADIHNIFISHLHDDHVAGLGTLALMHYFYPNYSKPNLYIHISLLKDLWERLRPGLETIEDGRLPKRKYKCDINDFFNVKVIDSNSVFVLGEMICHPVQTIHIVNGAEFMLSYGLEIEYENEKKVLITGDTQYAPDQLRVRQKAVDYIIHDCETSPFKSGVHANITDLVLLDDEIRKKMFICHYGDNIDDIKPELKEKFKGILKRGDVIEI